MSPAPDKHWRSHASMTVLFALLLLTATTPSRAADWFTADQGKLHLTGGFSDLEGSGGGGLVPWAVISGYGSAVSWGANAHVTGITLADLSLVTVGVAVGLRDRVEFSFARQKLDITGGPLDGLDFEQDVFGAKLRLAGDAVYDQDRWLPQLALGVQYKDHRGIGGGARIGNPALKRVEQLGADDDSALDVNLSASKLFLRQSLFVALNGRYTKANQTGLLGYGGDRNDDAELLPEATVALLLSRRFAIGGEFRMRPDNLGVDDEQDAWDLFAAWTPTKHVSLLLAYLNLGAVAEPLTGRGKDQDGVYLSVQVGL